MESKTLNELVDLAIERLPRWQALFVKTSLTCRPRKKREVVNAVAFRMAHDVQVRVLVRNAAVFGSENLDGETTIQVDSADLDRLLEIILEYLPAILQIILMFVQIMLPLALVFAIAGTSNAQWVCDESGCRQVQTAGECVDGKCYSTPVRNLAHTSAAAAVHLAAPARPVVRAAVKTVRTPVAVVRSRQPLRTFLRKLFCR